MLGDSKNTQIWLANIIAIEDIPVKPTVPKNRVRGKKMFETLKCLRDGKNIGGAGWMVGTELKGSIDNTNDLKWTINHISSPQQEC